MIPFIDTRKHSEETVLDMKIFSMRPHNKGGAKVGDIQQRKIIFWLPFQMQDNDSDKKYFLFYPSFLVIFTIKSGYMNF